MREEPVSFHSAGLRLQGLLFRPQTPPPHRAAVVCHPHPLYGGSMHSNVVDAILDALWSLGCATLRFNFRGVGLSEGEYGSGRGEAIDAASAVKFVTQLPGMHRDRVILAGYSFGAIAAANAAADLPEVFTLVAVAPPIITDGPDCLTRPRTRLVLVGGEYDRYCPPGQLEGVRGAYLGPVRLKIISGTDHFFAGQERELTEALIEALEAA